MYIIKMFQAAYLTDINIESASLNIFFRITILPQS